MYSGSSALKIMKRLPIVVMLAIFALACSSDPPQLAPGSGKPAIRVAVGPVPGSGKIQEGPTNPYAENSVATTEGRKLFVWYNCYGCHGGHGGGGIGPSLRDPDWIYGGSDSHIFDSIAQGRAHGMPAWGTKLPESQIWELVAYITSLGTNREPEAPVVVQPEVHISSRLEPPTPTPAPRSKNESLPRDLGGCASVVRRLSCSAIGTGSRR